MLNWITSEIWQIVVGYLLIAGVVGRVITKIYGKPKFAFDAAGTAFMVLIWPVFLLIFPVYGLMCLLVPGYHKAISKDQPRWP